MKRISWKDHKGREQEVVKKHGVVGTEKNAGYLWSTIAGVMPTVLIGAALMGTCVYRSNKQQEEFAKMGYVMPTKESEDRSVGSFRLYSTTPIPTATKIPTATPVVAKLMPGKYPNGKPDLSEFGDKTISILYVGDARISYYWPPYGGINCEEPCEVMSNGDYWKNHQDEAVACPDEFPFGSKVLTDFGTYTCLDRGGMIVFEDGLPWIDILSPVPIKDYGSIHPIEIHIEIMNLEK